LRRTYTAAATVVSEGGKEKKRGGGGGGAALHLRAWRAVWTRVDDETRRTSTTAAMMTTRPAWRKQRKKRSLDARIPRNPAQGPAAVPWKGRIPQVHCQRGHGYRGDAPRAWGGGVTMHTPPPPRRRQTTPSSFSQQTSRRGRRRPGGPCALRRANARPKGGAAGSVPFGPRAPPFQTST
jgi:hypothetical protein